MGANPDIEDDHGRQSKPHGGVKSADDDLCRAPKHLACERIFGGSPIRGAGVVEGLKSIFKDFDAIDDMDFSRIHQIELGLNSGSLEDESQKTSTQIDAQDRLGYTALTWAAQRNDIHALRLLLRYRANLDILDYEHCTPLRDTIFGPVTDGQEPKVMKMLVYSKVDTYPDSKHGVSALHDAAFIMMICASSSH